MFKAKKNMICINNFDLYNMESYQSLNNTGLALKNGLFRLIICEDQVLCIFKTIQSTIL